MPVLNMNGTRVNVDGGFLELSPEEQNRTVDEITRSIGHDAGAGQHAVSAAGRRVYLSDIDDLVKNSDPWRRTREGFASAFEEPLGMSIATMRRYPMWQGFQPLVAGADALMRLPTAAIRAHAGTVASTAEPFIGRAWADRLENDLVALPQSIAPEVPTAPRTIPGATMRRVPTWRDEMPPGGAGASGGGGGGGGGSGTPVSGWRGPVRPEPVQGPPSYTDNFPGLLGSRPRGLGLLDNFDPPHFVPEFPPSQPAPFGFGAPSGQFSPVLRPGERPTAYATHEASPGTDTSHLSSSVAASDADRLAYSVDPRMRSADLPGLRGEPAPTGSLNPLDNVRVTFRGKEPAQFTPEDWKDFGDYYGTPNLGPLSPLVTYKDLNGNDFVVPGGTEGKWTYYDLLHMKANPINPANIDRALHADMQRKLGRTLTPENLSNADVWNGVVFGITSPNNPLFPGQMTTSRLRLRSPELIDDLASMVPWKLGENVTPQQRKLVSDNIAQRYGLAAADKGGLGIRGSADYSNVGELAQMFKENPNFFRKRPDEDWGQAVERVSSQVRGLSMKTGSLGIAWQDPADAAVAAVDRNMARELDRVGGIFEGPEQRTAWQNRGVALWNKCKPDDPAKSWSDLMSKRGSDGFVGEMLLDHVSNAVTRKFRMKGGEVNPNIPEYLANANWVREPESVSRMGDAYKRAQAVNQKLADEHGLSLFMSQWMEWDRIRRRFEPHEHMFPGLSNTPAPSVDQLRAVDLAHKETGHKTYTKDADSMLQPTRPYKGPISQMGYLGLTGGLAIPALTRNDREKDAAD